MYIFKDEYKGFANQEAENLSKINHPNAIKLLNAGLNGTLSDLSNGSVLDNCYYILMEYIAGGDLYDI